MTLLTTKRLTLRHIAPDDYDAVFAMNQIYDLVKNTGSWAFPPDPDQIRDLCNHTDIKSGVRGVIVRDKTVIGQAGLINGMLYYTLHPDHWGNGYATEIARPLLSYGFHHYAWDVIFSGVFVDNPASVRVMEKLGMRETLPDRWYSRARGAAVDSRNFVMTRLEWALHNPLYLTTPRLGLQPLTFDHLAPFAALMGHPQVAPMMMPATVPWPEHAAAKIIAGSVYLAQLGFRMAIVLNDQMIGTCGVGPDGSVMFAIHPDHWGQGYATEATGAFIDHLFNSYPLTRMTADHFTDNPASGRVLSKLGFEHTGIGVGTSAARLEPAAVLEYAMSNPNVRIPS